MSGDKESPGNSDILKEKSAIIVDCSGMLCPHPILEIAKRIRQLQPGQLVELLATDPNTRKDIPTWCQKTGNKLVRIEEKDKTIKFYIQKSE